MDETVRFEYKIGEGEIWLTTNKKKIDKQKTLPTIFKRAMYTKKDLLR